MKESCLEYSDPSNDTIYVAKFDKKRLCFTFQGVNNGIYKTLFLSGKYRVELWGASAGDTIGPGYNYPGGKGGYTRGEIELRQETFFTFYVGSKGGNTAVGSSAVGIAGFNGGSIEAYDTSHGDSPSAGSGGSTDIRFRKNSSHNPTIYDRIMVAGGGGSSGSYVRAGLGGHGGGINGTFGNISSDSPLPLVKGATQTTGNQILQGGKGQDGASASGSGGGGYYGGLGGAIFYPDEYTSGGSGGSSYISGHPGCVAMDDQGRALGTSIHPSGLFFKNTFTIQGNSEMPASNVIDGFEELGHVGNGFVRITILSDLNKCSCNTIVYNIRLFLSLLEFIFISE
ncbi:PE-PGRS protein, putative [Trichomonas vaginalis G3]|uniref:receptor protein-tyrosine kinase n=1 Tax=Trichomonas vaginalis (strain ATCC PRA-98 / G3) TaxID=412133 RepID=A2ET04_TRIV3|nr:glycine-rich protein family [Trichomonas vaginalis G3]EAY04193.1 PE-PGRS protein, putative [Trichomonas vaginalis G3]KAI5493067.1 glycine-rich protein family [Trichomonas vaginalis G3]|eukprot:XP_001316416.1 PE-PGRS protein [Trichomonas vaginalis G3]